MIYISVYIWYRSFCDKMKMVKLRKLNLNYLKLKYNFKNLNQSLIIKREPL